jgi:methionine-rich copper-binding protein CopC
MKRILSTTATLSLSLAVLLGGASGALAHSDELKTSPEQGSTVEAGRIPIILTFGEELLVGDESISHEVVVTNEAGEILPALCASAEGFDLSTAAALDQPGTYVVTWRTVSGDGHPVSGSFDFKLVNTTDYDAATDAVDACASSSMAEPMAIAAPTDAADNTDTLGWLVAGGLVLLGAAAAISGRVLRARGLRRKNKSE